jgi:hypothetical protein
MDVRIMKIKPEHYDHMVDTMRAAQNAQPTKTRKAYEESGLTAKRHRWDLMHAAKLTPWLCANVYPYAHDSHVDTALRNVIYQLETETKPMGVIL